MQDEERAHTAHRVMDMMVHSKDAKKQCGQTLGTMGWVDSRQGWFVSQDSGVSQGERALTQVAGLKRV